LGGRRVDGRRHRISGIVSAPRASFPEEGMEITHLLVVRDVARSSRFYREVLGAEPYREYGGNSAVLRFLGCWLLLVTGGPPTEDKPSVSFAPPPDPDLVSRAWTIRVNDCQRAYEVLRARGASFLTPPVRHGQETRCFLRDPDGHLIELSEYRAG
jgi:catechol 2,3-dioxygenase-like lactoylglutathione lyase family enzyme